MELLQSHQIVIRIKEELHPLAKTIKTQGESDYSDLSPSEMHGHETESVVDHADQRSKYQHRASLLHLITLCDLWIQSDCLEFRQIVTMQETPSYAYMHASPGKTEAIPQSPA